MAVPFQEDGDRSTDPRQPEAPGSSSGSGLDALLGLIPDQFKSLRFTIQRIAETFPTQLGEITPERVQGWLDELEDGDGRTVQELRQDIFKHVVGSDLIEETLGVDATVAGQLISGEVTFSDFFSGAAGIVGDADGAPGAAGGTEEFPGIMPGGQLVQVQRAGQDDLFIQSYEWPAGSGQFVAWSYEGAEQVAQVFGPDWLQTQERQFRSEDWFSENVQIADAVGEVLGLEIGFDTFMGNVLQEVQAESAITDPSIWGDLANDPEIQNLIRLSSVGDWSEDRLQGEMRNSTFWTETLYPGIEQFYASGSIDPEGDWVRYQARMEPAYRALGIEPDPERGYRDIIGEDMVAGIDPDLAAEMVPVFQRAANSPAFASTLDAWMQRNLGAALDFDTWFDVLAGQAPPDVAQVVEQAQLQFVADQQSLTLDAEQIGRVAELSDLTEGQAAQAFEQVSAQLLALGDQGLARFGLSEDDILASQTGIEATSGRSISEIKQIARRTATELGLADDRKIQLYVGYDPTRGTPSRPGLGGLAPTGA